MGYILSALALALSCSKAQENSSPQELTTGSRETRAPDFSLPTVSGDTLTLSSLRGKVVIVDFWATWCPPCRMEIPHFQELYEAYKDKGLVVVGVALDEPEKVRAFVKANGMTYPVVFGNQAVADQWGGIQGIPTTFILDQEGTIRAKAVGYRPKAYFETQIRKLLGL